MDSSLEDAISIFKDNFEKYEDLLSLYMVAFIYDAYLNNPYKSIEFYNKYIKYEDIDNASIVNKRLNDIENLLNNKISILKQKIAYLESLEDFKYETSNRDTLLNHLELCKQTQDNDLKDKCNNILELLEFPNPLPRKVCMSIHSNVLKALLPIISSR